MGKKGNLFSTIKRVFTSNSKQSPLNEGEKKSGKEKKKGLGRLKHGLLIPLFREPISIEKILQEVDQHNLFIPIPIPTIQSPSQPPPSPTPSPPTVTNNSPPRHAAASPPPITPSITSPTRPLLLQQTKIEQHLSATRIQAAYRGYMERRKRRGILRLQQLVRAQNVKRQTVNAMKQMQLLVRVQTKIHSRRIQNQALNNDKQVETLLDKNTSEMCDEYWDDRFITKEEKDSRLQKKVDAVIKRERAMSYAYSHKLRKATPTKSSDESSSVMGGYHYPWWWNWLEHQLPSSQHIETTLTPCRLTPPDQKPISRHKQLHRLNTPMSSRSMTTSTTTPLMKYCRGRVGGYPMKDDDSFMSCPPFSVPNYMSPTLSAKAKARPTTNTITKDRFTPPGSSKSSKRRFSFPFTPNKSPSSIGDFSIHSDISMPVGRKPFNRFV